MNRNTFTAIAVLVAIVIGVFIGRSIGGPSTLGDGSAPGGDREVLAPWPMDNDVWTAELPADQDGSLLN